MAANKNLLVSLLITAKDQAGDVLDRLRGKLGELSGFVKGAAVGAFASLGAAIAASFAGGFNAAADFETVMARIRVAGVKSNEELAKLADAARKLGAETGVGAVPAAEALESLVKAGLSANEALNALPNIINLASGQMLGLSQTAELVVNTVNQFGLSFKDSQTIVDTFSAGANAATTSVEDLRQGLESAGLAARTAGLTLQQTIAVLNTLKQSGQGASEAGNALENMLNELGNASSPARQALLDVGVATGDFNAVVDLLAQGGPKATQVLNAFSDTARVAGGILANSLPFYQGQVRQLKDISVTAADGAKIMGGTYNESVKTLQASWSELWQTLAEPVIPKLTVAFQESTRFITENKQAISDWISTGLSPLTQAIDGYRLIWAAVSGDQEKVASIQADIAERTAAIGRALNGTSGEYQKNTQAVRDSAAASQAAATAGAQASSAIQGQAEQQAKLTAAVAGTSAAVATAKQAWEAARAEYVRALETGQNLEFHLGVMVERFDDYGRALREQARQQAAAADAGTEQTSVLDGLRDAYDRQIAELERLRQAKQAGQATDAQIVDATLKVRRALDDYTAAAVLQSQATERLNQQRAAGLATSDALTEKAAAEKQALLELAQLRQDDQAIAVARLGVAEQELQRTREKVGAAQLEAAGLTELLAKKEAEYALTVASNPAQQLELDLLRQQIAQKTAQAGAIAALLPVMEEERALAERQAGPIGQLSRLYGDLTAEHQRAAAAAADYYETQLREIDGSIRVAAAKGDEVEVARLKAEQVQIEIDQADALAAAKQQEAIDAQNAVAAKQLELAADGELSAADQQQIADLQAVADAKQQAAQQALDHVNALRDEASAARETASVLEDATQRAIRMDKEAAAASKERADNAKAAGDFFGGYLTMWSKYLEGFSAKAREAFDGYKAGTDLAEAGTEELTAALERSEDAQAKLRDTINGGLAFGLGQWVAAVANNARDIEQAFLSQRLQVQRAIDTLTEYNRTGVLTGSVQQAMIQNAGDLSAQFGLLDEQDLDKLRSALDSANAKLAEMQALTQDAKDRLAELNAELLEAQGQDAKAAQLRQQLDYQQQLAEIEASRAEAAAAGNRELVAIYDQQIAKLEEINRVKLANLAADAKAAATSGASNTTTTGGGTSTQGGRTTVDRGVSNTFNIQVDGSDLLSEETVRTKIVPILDRVTRLRA